tara:strand:+ start:1398 stop:1763 length:366 start_codon:yes stop_codon:yes gene_type:complete
MRLTEKRVVELIREAYDKRLNYFLNEKMDLETMGAQDADELKVRHSATRYEYTFAGITPEGLVKIYLPNEPRHNPKNFGQKRLLNDYIPEAEELDISSEDTDERDYILVDKDTFEKEYELA